MKSTRDSFSSIDVSSVIQPERFPKLLDYCAEDVSITHQILNVVFPKFLDKCPHPVSFLGSMYMAKMFLPVSNSIWKTFIDSAESKLTEYQSEIEMNLNASIESALQAYRDGTHSSDPWLKHLDWTIKTSKKGKKGIHEGKPQWLVDMWTPEMQKYRPSTSRRAIPYLLKLQWEGNPLIYHKDFGWMFSTPKTKPHARFKAISFSTENQPLGYDSSRIYYSIPHPGGANLKCGNPLAKTYLSSFENGILTSGSQSTHKILELQTQCSGWISIRNRIIGQFVHTQKNESSWGIILPQAIPMGTVTRRAADSTWLTASNFKKNAIGSELKAKLLAPAGYKFVGADVDSEELWIASLIGDAQLGIQGATALGFMTLQGSKVKETDMHSITGKIAGISRDQAKIFNYSRIYGAGYKYATQILMQCNPEMTEEEAISIALKMFKNTKGVRLKIPGNNGRTFWCGGSESFMFNELERIAHSESSLTPVLGCEIPNSLSEKYVADKV